MGQAKRHNSGRFELEVLEPRVLLSADVLLVSAVAANAVAHKPVESAHQESFNGQGAFHDSLHYNPAGETGGIFDGISGSAIHSQVAAPAQTEIHNGDSNTAGVETVAVQNSTSAVQPKAQVQAQAKVVVSSAVASTTTTSNSFISASATASSGSSTAQQLTASLTAANGPPASVITAKTSVSTSVSSSSSVSSTSTSTSSSPNPKGNPTYVDLYTTIQTDINAIANGGSTAPVTVTDVSLNGVVTFASITLTFTVAGKTVTSIAFSATSAGLNLGSAVNATIGAVSGNYYVSATTVNGINYSAKSFNLTLSNLNITLSSFVSIGATSANLTYIGGSAGQTVNLVNPSSSTAPTATDTVTMLTIGINGGYVFAGVNGTAGTTSSAPASQATNAEGLSITGVNLALAIMSSTATTGSQVGAVYYGLAVTGGTVTLVGLPSAFNLSVSNLAVGVNGGNTAANGYAVDFTTTTGTGFTAGTGLTVQTGGTGSTAIALDYNQPLVQASGTVDLNLSGFIYAMGTMYFQAGTSTTVNLTDGSTTTTGGVTTVNDNGGTALVSVLEIAATNITVFAGVNGPVGTASVIPTNAIGVEIQNASFALVLMTTSAGVKYYGLQAGIGAANVIASGAKYDSSGNYTLSGLTPGETYQWTQGNPVSPSTTSGDATLTAGSTTLSSSGTFVAPSNGTVTLTGTASAAVTASVAPLSGMTALGLPSGITISSGTVSVSYNGTTSTTAPNEVVDFDSSFTTAAAGQDPRIGGLTIQTTTATAYLDFTSPLVAVSGSLTLDFNGFIYVTGNIFFQQGGNTGGTLNLTSGTTKIASMLEIGASDVTIFAGVNGPSTNSAAVGMELDNAGFALALISGTDGNTYYGLQATAGSLSAIGLPSGFNLSGTNLGVVINGSTNGNNVVNFDTSFTAGTGLTIVTGGGNTVNLDFTTQLVQAYGSINLQFSSYLSISGSFNYSQTSGTSGTSTTIILGSAAFTGATDVTVTLGTGSSTLFTATGSLSMTITSGLTTIASATLSVPELKVANVLDVVTPTVTLANIAINNATGAISTSGNSTLTVTAVSATLFKGSTVLNGSVTALTGDSNGPNGLTGTFNLVSGAFAVTLESFTLNVSTALQATATDVQITYSPGAGSSQQIVSISTLNAVFTGFGGGDITGSITNLVIYGNGFKFDSATLSYTGDITVGSILKLTNPSVTLGNFSVTFDGSNTTLSASSLSVGVDSASLAIGTFTASATGLTISVSLSDGSTTIVAATINFAFGSYLTLSATSITINTNPDANGVTDGAYLTIGTATASLNAGSFSVTGSATSFSVIDHNGSAEFQAGSNFSVTLTTPTASQLLLPSWLGFNVSKFEISWVDFNSDPGNFQITLSASITSIKGLPGGVTVSGEITDAVIDPSLLLKGEFPITSIGSVGGSVSGTLFGLEVNAAFVLGIVQFNAENEIVSGGVTPTVTKLTTNSDGSVTETTVTGGDTTVVNSIMYVGVAGGASIPGVGGVQIYIGFSSLGPLTFYLSAQFPLILDPDTGLAIGGFSGGVIFDYTIPTPGSPQDLATLNLSPASVSISQWQQQLRDQTVTQYTSSSGGTDLSAAYSQPFVIEAGVTLYDAYLSADAFTLTGNIAIQINPASPDSTSIFVSGTATFGASVSFNAYLYLNITVSGGSSTATVMFLGQAPASLPVETIGGSLQFGFVDSNGNPITPPTVASTIESEWIAAGATYDSTGAASLGSLQAGTYTWTPGTNDISLTVGTTTYTATSTTTNGVTTYTPVTFTTTATETASLTGTANAVISGTLSSAGNITGAAYTINTFTPPAQIDGFYLSLDGFAQFSAFGTLTATVSGSVTLTVTSTFAKIDLSGDLSVSTLGDLATATGEIVVDYSGGFGIYGALQLATGSGFAKLQNVGLYVDGAATFIINTTDSAQTVYLPDPHNPHVTADATEFDITDVQSFEVTIGGTTPGTYASLSYQAGGDTLLNMSGSFDLKISSSGLTMFADIESLSVGPSASPFLTLSGFGLFVINAQGFAAEMDLSLSADAIEGITMNAQFTLVMNTTGANVVYTIPSTLPPVTIPGSNPVSTTRSLTIPSGPPQGALQSDGTYGTNVGPAGPYIVITAQGSLNIYNYSFTGFFYFQLSDSSAGPVVALYLNVMGDLGFGNVNVTGGFELSSDGVVVLLQASGQVGPATSYGPGVSLVINAELAINTTNAAVSQIGGVALTDTNGNPLTIAAKSAQVVASGTLTMTFGPGSLVINGIFTTSLVVTGSGVTEVDVTTITANGTLTATVGGTVIFQRTAVGVLVFSSPGPQNQNTFGTNGLGIAGELSLSASGSNPLSGTGFSFTGTFDLEINTTEEAQSVTVPGLSSPVVITAGPNGSSFGSVYAEIHAYGTMLFGSNAGTASSPIYTGFALNGDFYLTVGSAGLAVSANVILGIYVAGSSLLSVNAQAAMAITPAGLAASLVVTARVSDPDGLYGFGGTLSLQVNTTGVQQTIGTVIIPAAPGGSSSTTGTPYFQIYISGTLALGTTDATIYADSTGMYVSGNFYLTISPAGLSVVANGTLTAYVDGSPLLTMQASGALIINAGGIAGELTLTVNEGDPLDSSGLYSFSGSFNLQLNTTGNNYYIGTDGTIYNSIPAAGTTYTTLSAGPQGASTGGFYFEVEASGTLTFGSVGNGFSLAGNLYISVGSEGLAVSANAAFTANVLNKTLLTMNASGAFIITGSGIAGELTLTFGVGASNPLNGVGFAFTGGFSLVVNTTGINYYVGSDGSISMNAPSTGTYVTISAGQNGDTDTPGNAYFEIDANGTLLFGTAANGFALTGDLFLSVGTDGLAVSTNDTFNVTVGGTTVISLTASGAMEITSAGLAASLTLTASSGNSLFTNQSSFGFSGLFTFQLNTTNKAINDMIGDTPLVLAAGPYFQIYVSGALGLGTNNTSAATGMFLSGTFYLTISTNGLAIAATTNLTAVFDGTTLLTLGAKGGLILTSGGLAGAISLTIGSSNPLSGTGFSFTGTFTLQVNTTQQTYYFWSNGTVSTNAPNATNNPGVSIITTVSAGPGGSNTGSTYFQVYASGAIVFGTSSNGFSLSGSFFIAIGTTGLSISVSTSFTASVLGTQLISVSANGAMEITSAGLAASLSLTVPSLGIAGVFNLSGTVAFQINTTNQAVNDTVGGVALNLAKGPYFQLSVTGASLTFLGGGTGFGLTNGSFILSIGSAGMAISASATLNLTIASVNIATFTATGALLVTSNGIAAKLDLTLTSGFSQSGSNGFSFSASFELEINTTSSAINTINNQTVSIPRGPFFEILASGSLMMGGVLSITGSFTFTLSSNGVLISMNASVNVFGVSFTVNGFAAIYSSGGIALQITLSVGNSTNPTVTLIPGVLALSGSFVLQINTTSNSSFNVNGTNYSITPGTIFNISITASLNVFGFSLATASINIALVVNGSNSSFTASGTTSFNFFGFATFGVDFYFSANLNNGNVQYWFYGGIYLRLGSSGFNIHGSLTFEVSNVNTTDTISGGSYYGQAISTGLTIRIDGGVTAFGFNFGSIGASINIDGTSVSFSVYVSISFFFFSIGGTVTIHLGSISPVPSPPPPPTGTIIYSSTTIDGQTFGAGTLLINVGQYANSNRGVAPQANENYTITYLGTNSDGSENISVTAVGVNGGAAETYNSVKEIVIPDADIGSGTSNMNVTISSGVTLPVVIFAGSGKNTFTLGGGTATVNGTDGNDTVNAGSGFVTFYAGSGQNLFNGSTGGASIFGSSGNDTVIGGTGNVTFTVGSGNSTFTGGGTGSTHNTIIDPGNVNVIENNYSSYTLIGTSATAAILTYGGNTDTLTNTDGGITVTLKGVTTGAETFTATNYSGNVMFDAAGNTNVTTTITVATGNMTVNNIGNLANTITESNGTTGTITLQSTNSSNVAVAYGAVTLDGGAAANTITVNSWSGSGALTLDGMGGSDNYVINFQSSGSFTVNVNDSGTSGTDVMTVNGTASAATLYVNSSSVTLGSQVANYTGVENLTVNTAADSEAVDVSSTSAATTINTGGYTDTVNIGSNAATNNAGGTLNNVVTLLTINGTGSYDTLNLDDTGDATANTGTLTGTTLSGVFGASGSLVYSNIKTLNLNLGTGADTLYITATTSVTNINASLGTSASTLSIGSNEPSVNGLLSNIRGALTITGNANTIVNVDDTGDVAATGVLTGTTLKGLGMVSNGITYSGLKTLNISLGNNGNFFTITNTHATTATTLNSGTGKDTVNVTTDSGITIINGNGGGDTVNVTTDGGTTTINETAGNNTINLLGTGATTNINTSNGSNVINIGSKAPSANGIVNTIQGAIYIVGSGTDTANVGDTGSKNSKTGQLTSTTLTGLNMVAGGITYSGLKTLIISLGSGGNTFNVLSTYSGTTTTVNTGTGTNTVTVTSNAPANNASSVLTGIAGSLIINGQGADTLNVDDTGDTGSGVLTQTVTTLTGLGMGASGITYTSVETLNINLGAHGNTIFIQGNPINTTENLNTGTGTNIISIGSAALSAITTNPLTGNATNTGSVLDNVQGIINITGSGTDTMNVDDSGSTNGENGGLWANKLQFLNPGVIINFTGISALYISLSEAADQFAISDTFTSASTTPAVVIDGNQGNDTFVIFDTHAVTTINGGDGDDNFYDFGNSAVMNLNGNADDDTFYVYASVSSNTTNVGPGAADSNGNQIYSYRVNAAVNIDGGTGNDRVFIFGTVLNDVITITSTSVTGAGIDVNFTNVEQLTVAGLGGDDTFYIESIAIPTTIIGDGTIVLPSVAAFLAALGLGLPNLNGNAPPATSFNDTFYVGWQGANYIPGSLSGINSTLLIEGDNGPGLGNITTNFPGTNDTVYVDDSGDTANRNYSLSPTTLTSNAMGPNGSVTYDIAVENFNLYVGQGTNTITVNGNTTGTQMSIYGGRGNDSFIVNDTNPLQSPLAIIGGTNTFAGDTLTVNGGTAGNTYDITGYTIDGQGATISYEEIEKLIINASGATTFNVNGDSVPTYLNGGSGNDTFIVNSNTTSLYLSGGTGNETFVINGNSGALAATATTGTNSFTVNGNSSTLTMNGGSGTDSFVINANSGTLTANGNAGADTFVVNAISSAATLNGGAGNDTFTVNTPLAAVLTVNGGGDAGDLLIVNGTIGNDYFTITNNSVNGVGSAILYNTISNLTVNGVAGNDTFLVLSDSATTTTTLNGSTGNDLFYVRTTSGPTIVNTGGGINTVDIGANEPYTTGNILDGIQGAVTVNGGDQDVLNVDDSASSSNKNGILTATTLTGLGMGTGGITYYGIPLLNLKLGSGSDTLNVRSTNATTIYNVNLGAGTNIVNIGSLTPILTGGIVDGVQGTLNLTGSGNDTLNVDDTGSTAAKTGAMTSSTISGLGMGVGGVTYVGFTVLNISLGSGGNTFTITSTLGTTVTTVNSGSGADMVNLLTDSGITNINSQAGNDTINIQSTGATTNVNTGAGTNVVNVGSLAPLVGGIVNNIQGTLNVTGSGSDTLNVDDTGSTDAKTGLMTSSTITGLGMGVGGITYTGLATLNIELGSGSDTINIQSTGATTNVNTGAGTNVVNVGSLAPLVGGIVNNIQGTLNVTGSGSDTLNVDDTGSTDAKTGSMTSSTITGLGMGVGGITYTGLANLNISLGSGGNTFTINSTYSATVTTLNSGSGSDTVNLFADSGMTNINTQAGNDVVNVQTTGATTNVNTGSGTNTLNVGSLAPTVGGKVNGIQGAVNVTGSGTDTLNVDDTGSMTAKTGTMTSSTITGLGMGVNGISYTGLATLNIKLGSGSDTFNIQSTYVSTVNNLNTGSGTNTVNVGSLAPLVGGIVDNIQGTLNVTGSGSDTLNVDDTGSTGAKTGSMTSSTITGLGMGVGGITYTGLSSLNISLGSGGNTFAITSTLATTVTRLNSGNGVDTVNLLMDSGITNINGQAGNDTINIQSTGATTNVNTGAGVNTVNIGSLAPAVGGILNNIQGTVNVSGSGSDTLNVDDTGSTAAKTGILTANTLTDLGMGVGGITYSGLAALNISLGSGGNTFTITSTSTNAVTVTTLNSGSGNDTVNVLADYSITNINTQAGNDVVNVQTTGATTNVNTGSGTNVVNVGSLAPAVVGNVNGIQGALNVTGSGTDTMNVDDTGSTAAKAGTMTSSTITGLGMGTGGITYTGLAALNIMLGNGGNTFTVGGTSSATTRINSGNGNDTFNIQATTGTLYAYGDGGSNTFNLGSLAPVNGGTLNKLNGAIFITGSSNALRLITLSSPGTNIVNLDDSGDSTSNTGTLTSSTLTGLGMGSGVTFVSVNVMNIKLGSGNDTFNVQTTNAGTVTNLNTGGGVNVVNVGSLAPVTGSVVNGIQGMLNVTGNGSDTVNVDDTGSTGAKTGTLTSSSLTGLGLGTGGITYTGLAALNISLGSGGNSFTIISTKAATVTTLNSGSGADAVNLLADSGVTNINGQAGNDTINIQSTGATTNVNTGAGVNTVNIGSLAPVTGGIVNNIQGTVNVTGSGSDILNVDDTGSTVAKTGALTYTTITGLGMGAGGITYTGLATLNIKLGAGSDTFNVQGTNAGTVTNLNTGAGTNVVNIGSLAPNTGGIVNNIQGTLNVTGSGNDTMNVDDTGSTAAKNGLLTATTLTGLGMSVGGINYSGLIALNINLGAGSDTFTITGVTNTTVTTVNGGTGTNTVVMNFSGNFAGNLTLLNFATSSLYVGGDFSGTLTDGGAFTLVTIVGSLTSTGVLNAGSITTMTVGVDLAGLLNVTGLLGTLTITGGSPGKIVVGSVNVINVLAGYGNKVLQVITAGIERDITVTPVAGGTMPNTVHFAIVYDAQSASDPQAAIRVTDTSGTVRSYNVALVVVNSSTAKFNLSRLDSNGATGIGNISIQGDLLTKLTTPELALFTNLTSSSSGGIVLASDNIIGVEVSGKLPEGFIMVAGIEGLAFSSLTTSTGAAVTVTNLLGTTGGLQAFWAILGSHAALNSATDVLVIPFVVAQPVSVFAHIDSNTDMALVLTLSDRNTNNLPLTAYVQLAPLSGSNTTVAVQSLTYSTSGGSATSPYLIRNTSTLN